MLPTRSDWILFRDSTFYIIFILFIGAEHRCVKNCLLWLALIFSLGNRNAYWSARQRSVMHFARQTRLIISTSQDSSSSNELAIKRALWSFSISYKCMHINERHAWASRQRKRLDYWIYWKIGQYSERLDVCCRQPVCTLRVERFPCVRVAATRNSREK